MRWGGDGVGGGERCPFSFDVTVLLTRYKMPQTLQHTGGRGGVGKGWEEGGGGGRVPLALMLLCLLTGCKMPQTLQHTGGRGGGGGGGERCPFSFDATVPADWV